MASATAMDGNDQFIIDENNSRIPLNQIQVF